MTKNKSTEVPSTNGSIQLARHLHLISESTTIFHTLKSKRDAVKFFI